MENKVILCTVMCALLQWIEHVFISDIVGYMLMVTTYFVVDMRF